MNAPREEARRQLDEEVYPELLALPQRLPEDDDGEKVILRVLAFPHELVSSRGHGPRVLRRTDFILIVVATVLTFVMRPSPVCRCNSVGPAEPLRAP